MAAVNEERKAKLPTMARDAMTALPEIPLPQDLEPAEELGPCPEMLWLPLLALTIDARYQREIVLAGRKLIVRMIEDFSWASFKPLTVAPCGGGRYAVIDGQHQAIAAQAHPRVFEVPCYLVGQLEVEGQARAFMGVNRDRTRVSPMELYKAGLAARDPDALRIKRVCERAGVRVQRVHRKDGQRPGTTVAVSAINRLLYRHGEKPVVAALKAINEAYPETPGCLGARVIRVLVGFFATHGPDGRLDRGALVEVLKRIDLTTELVLVRRLKARGETAAHNGVRMLVRHYNRERPATQRLAEWQS